MNGKKRNSNKLVLDSGKINHFLQVSLTSKNYSIRTDFFKKFNIYNFDFFREKLKRNESQKEDSFQI